MQLTKPPTEDTGQWQLVITSGTDDEGWQYGTVFKWVPALLSFPDQHAVSRLWLLYLQDRDNAAPAVVFPA